MDDKLHQTRKGLATAESSRARPRQNRRVGVVEHRGLGFKKWSRFANEYLSMTDQMALL
jgi:hypothetical protein